MKKKFLKKHFRFILKALGMTAFVVMAYIVAHNYATGERGYEAVGGEIFVPLLIIFAEDIWEILKAPFKKSR